jgi:hypothetical protein
MHALQGCWVAGSIVNRLAQQQGPGCPLEPPAWPLPGLGHACGFEEVRGMDLVASKCQGWGVYGCKPCASRFIGIAAGTQLPYGAMHGRWVAQGAGVAVGK